MSNRFKGLITDNQFQRKKRINNQFNLRNKNGGNGIKISRSKPVKPDFKLDKTDFPTLETDETDETDEKKIIKTQIQTNYIDITNMPEHVNMTNAEFPKNDANNIKNGWTAMKFNKSGNVIFNDKSTISIHDGEKKRDKYREKYNRSISKFIIDERLKFREELNEILGDISPYWNNNHIYVSDDDANSENNDYYSSESEHDYCNE